MGMELQQISYGFGGRTFTGFLADGAKGQRAPGVLVCHQGNGLKQHAKDRARMVADLGYVAFALDMFGGPVDATDKTYRHIAELSAQPAELRGRAAAGLDVLRKHPSVDSNRLAAIGFCFGGQVILELARTGAALRCVVGFHPGLAPSPLNNSANIKTKVLMCLGNQDPFAPPAQREAFLAEMEQARVDCRMLVIAGAEHSFTDPDAGAANLPGAKYDAIADRYAWDAMKALFAETMT